MHTPVLLDEVLKYLNPKPGQKFIDATINGGGHGLAILKKIQPDGKLLGIEWDSQLLKQLELKVKSLKFKDSLTLVNDSYVNLKKIAERERFLKADGVLFDFGMSSWHLEQSGRGFSFQKDEILDMRFNVPMPKLPFVESRALSGFQSGQADNLGLWKKTNELISALGRSALEIVNTWNEENLKKIITDYGEERFAGRIAKNILEARKVKIIKTTFELAEIIKNSVPKWYGRRRLNPATKTFQALRIAVNNELENIAKGIDGAVEILGQNGKLAVISFHALEDRIIKQKFKEYQKIGLVKILTKKAVKPQYEEIKSNPRARSAKLRVCQKL